MQSRVTGLRWCEVVLARGALCGQCACKVVVCGVLSLLPSRKAHPEAPSIYDGQVEVTVCHVETNTLRKRKHDKALLAIGRERR
jgi:hypothetical protein